MEPNTSEARQLLVFIERIERVEETIRDEQEARKEIYSEAKSSGYDVKIMRKVVAIRKQDRDKRREEEEILSLYLGALGMLADTPLGRAAVDRDFGRAA